MGKPEQRELLDVGLRLDGAPNAFVSVSAGDSRHKWHIVMVLRHQEAPVWRVPQHSVLREGTNPFDVATEFWRVTWLLDGLAHVNQIQLLADITVAGGMFAEILQEHPNAARGTNGVQRRVVSNIVSTTASAGKRVGRRELVAPLSTVLAAGQFTADSSLLKAARNFKYDPVSTTINGEDAWRIDDQDGPALAMAMPLHSSKHTIPTDIRTGQSAPVKPVTAQHPICEGVLCACPNCVRCSMGADAGFRRAMQLCGWCVGTPAAIAGGSS